jgi:hypothetical protein
VGFRVGVPTEADEADAVRFLMAARTILFPATDNAHMPAAQALFADRWAVLRLWARLEEARLGAVVIAGEVRTLLVESGRLELVERFLSRLSGWLA